MFSSACRWLDKAAVVEPSISVDEQIRKARLCTPQQVEQAKTSLSLAPFCMTFLVYGLLQATGTTFFFEQSNYTDNRLGHIAKVPIIILVVIRTSTGIIVSWICDLLFPFFWGDITPRFVLFFRIGAGMAIAPLCCLVAYEVESYRVRQYVYYNVSVSGALLVPQFVLLGTMDGLVFDGLVEVYYSMVPQSLGRYGPTFAEFTLGIGHFLGLLSVVIFRDLFGENLDESRLGLYYRNLGFVCLANLVVYPFIARCYLEEAPFGTQAMEQAQQSEDNSAANIELVYNYYEMSQNGISNN